MKLTLIRFRCFSGGSLALVSLSPTHDAVFAAPFDHDAHHRGF
jgi:hypothetical protein